MDVDSRHCSVVISVAVHYFTMLLLLRRHLHYPLLLLLKATTRTSIIIGASTTNYYLIKSDFVIVATALHLLPKPSLAATTATAITATPDQ